MGVHLRRHQDERKHGRKVSPQLEVLDQGLRDKRGLLSTNRLQAGNRLAAGVGRRCLVADGSVQRSGVVEHSPGRFFERTFRYRESGIFSRDSVGISPFGGRLTSAQSGQCEGGVADQRVDYSGGEGERDLAFD